MVSDLGLQFTNVILSLLWGAVHKEVNMNAYIFKGSSEVVSRVKIAEIQPTYIPQRTHDVYTKLHQCRCNVIALHRFIDYVGV